MRRRLLLPILLLTACGTTTTPGTGAPKMSTLPPVSLRSVTSTSAVPLVTTITPTTITTLSPVITFLALPKPSVYVDSSTPSFVTPTTSSVPPSTSTTKTSVLPPRIALTRDEMSQLLIQGGWPQDLIEEALSVSFCESQWKPWARNPSSSASGLFQFLSVTWFEWGSGDVFDPLDNVSAAWRLYSATTPPWTRWTCKP